MERLANTLTWLENLVPGLTLAICFTIKPNAALVDWPMLVHDSGSLLRHFVQDSAEVQVHKVIEIFFEFLSSFNIASDYDRLT